MNYDSSREVFHKMAKKDISAQDGSDQSLDQPLRRSSTGKRVVVIILSVLLLLCLMVWALCSYYLSLMGTIDNSSEAAQDMDQLMSEDMAQEGTSPYETIDPDDVVHETVDPDDVVYGASEEVINILLIGEDRREGETYRCRSDAMILCSFDTKNNTLTMASFLRDMYVQIPGYNDNRLNYAYPAGGTELLDEAMLVNFNIHIDANIVVDLSGFTKIIDILGGVDIELTQDEADYMNLGFSNQFTAGVNHLNGEQALYYSRIRYIGTDFARTDRQRTVLSVLMEKFHTIDLASAMSLANEILPLVATDIESSEILGYVQTLLPILQSGNVKSFHVPGDDAYTYNTIRYMSVVLPNMAKVRQQLAEYLSP